jgi:hypothetical protein
VINSGREFTASAPRGKIATPFNYLKIFKKWPIRRRLNKKGPFCKQFPGIFVLQRKITPICRKNSEPSLKPMHLVFVPTWDKSLT